MQMQLSNGFFRRVCAAGLVVLAGAAGVSRADATPSAAVVLTDAANDPTLNGTPVVVSAPPVDLLTASLASTGQTLTVSVHVADVDGQAAIDTSGGAFDYQLSTRIGDESVAFDILFFPGSSATARFMTAGADLPMCDNLGTPPVVDTAADTIAATFSIAEMNECPEFQSSPIHAGTTMNGFHAMALANMSATYITDSGTSSSSYTI
jgi:hypothetical protein